MSLSRVIVVKPAPRPRKRVHFAEGKKLTQFFSIEPKLEVYVHKARKCLNVLTPLLDSWMQIRGVSNVMDYSQVLTIYLDHDFSSFAKYFDDKSACTKDLKEERENLATHVQTLRKEFEEDFSAADKILFRPFFEDFLTALTEIIENSRDTPLEPA